MRMPSMSPQLLGLQPLVRKITICSTPARMSLSPHAGSRGCFSGTVTLPLIGQVKIGGKTIDEAAGQITAIFDDGYLVNPQVSLTIVEYGKRRFTVLGQVQRPGTYEMPSEDAVNLMQAISIAGGF